MDHELRWRKSSYSGGDNGECVEVAHTLDSIRDSKNPAVILQMTSSAWVALRRLLGQ